MINKVTIYGADAFPTSPNATEESISGVIASLAGYTSIDVPALLVDEVPHNLEGEGKTYIDGVITSPPHVRRSYNFKLFPMAFPSTASLSYWDASNERLLSLVLRKKAKWISLTQFATDTHSSISYHTSGYAVPVEVRAYGHAEGGGTKQITITFFKKYREQ